jgi:hypothetical protein
MTASRLVIASLAVAFFIVLAPHSAFAQNAGGQNNGGRQGNRQRGNFDPAQQRERALTRVKEQLGATDDEWKVLQPKIDALMTAQADLRSGTRGGRGGRGNRGNQQNQAATPTNETAVAKAMADLRTAVADKATPADELAKKLAALHDAKAKAQAARTAAQKEVKDLLTARQEAILVQNGMLE